MRITMAFFAVLALCLDACRPAPPAALSPEEAQSCFAGTRQRDGRQGGTSDSVWLYLSDASRGLFNVHSFPAGFADASGAVAAEWRQADLGSIVVRWTSRAGETWTAELEQDATLLQGTARPVSATVPDGVESLTLNRLPCPRRRQ